MPNIRVLIQDAPTMMREILEQAISDEPHMELIPEPVVSTQAANSQPLPPDIVVVGVNDSEAAERARALLDRWPESHLLLITAGGRRVLKYELLPRGVDLGDMSPGQVVEAVRSAVRTERKPHVH